MAKRRHSVRRHKRVKTRNRSRASFKRGGDFTPDEPGQPKPYVPFYNEKGKQTIENAKFLDPTKISNVKKTDQRFDDIFQKSNPNDVAEVFSQVPGYFSKDSEAKRNRTAAIEEFNRLTAQYKNATGGLKRRKTFKRKASRRKSRRSK
jgi:hypothetical protein